MSNLGADRLISLLLAKKEQGSIREDRCVRSRNTVLSKWDDMA